MTQHIKKIGLIFLVILNLSCKESLEENKSDLNKPEKLKVEKKEISSSEIVSVEVSNDNEKSSNWVYYKVASLSDSYSCDDNKKYKDFKFNILNDSIIIDNKYTDDVFSGEIKADAILKKHGISKEFILNNFKVFVSEKIKYIRNKKAFQSGSALDGYFQDAFFIGEYLLFEKDGCVYCFKKDKNKNVENNKKDTNYFKLPISSNKIADTSPLKIDKKTFKEYTCGSDAYGYNLGKMNEFDVYIVNNDCGDFPYKDLIVLNGNKIISKLLIESDSWDIEKDEKKIRDEIISSFEIDTNFNIKIKTTNKINNKLKSNKIDIYQIFNGKIIKK